MVTSSLGPNVVGVQALVVGLSQFLDDLNTMTKAVKQTTQQLQSLASASATQVAPGIQKTTQASSKLVSTLGTLAGAAGIGLGGLTALFTGPVGILAAITAVTVKLGGLKLLFGLLFPGLAVPIFAVKTAFDVLGKTLDVIKGGISGLVDTVGNLIDGFVQLAQEGINALVQGAINLTGALVDLAIEGSTLEGIARAFAGFSSQITVSARSGEALRLSLVDLRRAAAGTISDFDLMRRANLALLGTGAQLREEFGAALPRVLEIARAGARATGKDFDFLFNKLVQGIKRSEVRLTDDLGLIISQVKAKQDFADAIGVTVGALTAEEESLAFLQAILKEADRTFGDFTDTQLTGAEVIARADAQLQNLKDTFSLALQPAVKTIAGAFGNLLLTINRLIGETGALRPVLIGIGAVFGLVADGIAGGIDKITNQFDIIGEEFSDTAEDMVMSAFTWGAELVANFALGMIDAASTVLSAAMNAITNLLTGWMAPGSPPRIAPNIDKWGAATLTEWLSGFSEADFGVLTDLERTLGKFLDGPAFQNISARIIEAINQFRTTGAVDVGFFDELAALGGDFGGQIAQLARLQFDFAEATDAAADAEERLDAAQQRVTDAQGKVRNLVLEYNRLLRAGADDSVLEARLAEINATEDEIVLAQEQRNEAEIAAKEAAAKEKSLKEQVSLQQQLVNQLLALAEAEAKAEKEARKKKPRLGAGAEDEIRDLIGGISQGLDEGIGNLADTISTSIDNMKELFKEELGRIFEPVKERWRTDILALLNQFVTLAKQANLIWLLIRGRIKFWADLIGLIFTAELPDDLTALERGFNNFKNWLRDKFVPFISKVFIPEGLETILTMLETIATFLKGEAIDAWQILIDFLTEKVIPFFSLDGVLAEQFNAFKAFVLEPLLNVLEKIVDALTAGLKGLQELLNANTEDTGDGGGGGGGGADGTPDATVIEPVTTEAAEEVLNAAATTAMTATDNMLDAATVVVTATEKVLGAATTAMNTSTDLFDEVQNFHGFPLPQSELFKHVIQFMKFFFDDLWHMAAISPPQLATLAGDRSVSPLMTGPFLGGGNQVQMDLGGVNINNGMDEVAFQVMVRQAVVSALREVS